MKTIEAKQIVGGLSKPSKMPGKGHSISAKLCITGSKLRKVKGSTCENCYAMKGRYYMNTTQNALQKRLEGLQSPRWVEAMVKLIPQYSDPQKAYFRIHDSGDLQGVWHLEQWNKVAKLRPDIKFWLPTREFGMVKEWLLSKPDMAKNLNIRLSEHMLNQIGPAKKLAEKYTKLGYSVTYSACFKDIQGKENVCPALTQGNECKDCRNCWDSSVKEVVYKEH